jgi:3-deoxy-D-manno-octulosonic-acid transferase
MVRFAYNLLLALLLPFVFLRLRLRARRQPEYFEHVAERFGRYPQPVRRPTIWIHAVSVGETRAAQPLVADLLDRHPEYELLLTHMTPTGRAASAQLFGERVRRCYLPYDYPFAVRAFLRHFRPRLGILMETELWPNLLCAAGNAQLPVLLVNARLSEKSARGYARVRRLVRPALAGLAAVAAQTAADAGRLERLGAQRVEVLGNLKFDLVPPREQMDAGAGLRLAIGPRPVLLCASTRDGEEALVLAALGAQPFAPTVLTVIVPRHPQRFDEVAGQIASAGFRMQRRSAASAVAADTQVLLGDTMGELFAYYAACDVAFVGGSLLALGGQNLIEACAVGAPVLIGPHTFNFAQASEDAIAAGAARRVADAAELIREAQRLLADPSARGRMGEAGRAFAAAHRGATARTLALVERFLSVS